MGEPPAIPITAPKPDRESGGLAEALKHIPGPEIPHGDGRITGVVVGEDGSSVPGVRIAAYLNNAMPFEGLLDGAKGEEDAVRRFVGWIREGFVPVAESVSDGSGSFSLEGLGDADYSLQANLDGYQVERASWGTVRPGAMVRFEAKRLLDLRVDIVLPDETRPREAHITVSGNDGVTSTDWTPEQPVLRFPAGRYELQARVYDGGRETFESEEVGVTLDAEHSPADVVLKSSGSKIVGCIRGAPPLMPGANMTWTVHAILFNGDATPSLQLLVEGGKEAGASGGTYEIVGLPPGRYLVGFGAGFGDDVLATRVVDLTDTPATCDFGVEDVDPARLLRVRVLDPEGRILPDARVSTGLDGPRVSTWSGPSFVRDDGTFDAVLPSDASRDVAVHVEAESSRYGSRRRILRAGERDIEVRFSAPAWLEVELAGDETGIGPWVALAPAQGGQRIIASCSELRDGRFEIGPVDPGTYGLLVFSEFTKHHSLVAARREVALGAGRNRTTVSIPAMFRLAVTGLDPGAWVMLRPEPSIRWQQSARAADAGGTVVFEKLPAGRYVLGAAGGLMGVRLDKAKVVRFEAAEPNALEVCFQEGSPGWAATGLESGDVIVGVDGAEFTTPGQLGVEWRAAMKRAKVTLRVVRGNRTLDLPVSTEDLNRAKSGGGSIEPTMR